MSGDKGQRRKFRKERTELFLVTLKLRCLRQCAVVRAHVFMLLSFAAVHPPCSQCWWQRSICEALIKKKKQHWVLNCFCFRFTSLRACVRVQSSVNSVLRPWLRSSLLVPWTDLHLVRGEMSGSSPFCYRSQQGNDVAACRAEWGAGELAFGFYQKKPTSISWIYLSRGKTMWAPSCQWRTLANLSRDIIHEH